MFDKIPKLSFLQKFVDDFEKLKQKWLIKFAIRFNFEEKLFGEIGNRDQLSEIWSLKLDLTIQNEQ